VEVVILGLAMMDVVVGLISLGLCIPLVQRRIGRNAAYGFRTPRTLASDKAWYAVNYGAAKAGVYMSIGMVIFGIVVALLPSTMSDHMEDAVLCTALVAPLVLVLGLIVAMNFELKKLDRSTGDRHADPEEML
jgi:SdpI/YfhL protein family